MTELNNTSYIFIPVSMEKQSDFTELSNGLEKCKTWLQIHDEITYMLKYVADKINSRDRANCQCFHYRFNEEQRNLNGLVSRDIWYSTQEHSFHNNNEVFRFKIQNVDLFCFSTGICILAFRIHFERSDPFWIASAQYYLKKVSREIIKPDMDGYDETTLLDLAKRLLKEFDAITDFTYYYYANPSTERANVLTYLEVPPKENYKKELFYLRRCYSEGFIFQEDELLERDEIYIPSPSTVWGISPEAAVCLACPESGNEEFIRKKFYNNFKAQYLFMYVLLLHQKYVLYYFYTKIGIGTYNNLETLEEYRNQLYEFETDFVFSLVTEVPQYQRLYDRMTKAFSLKKMYEDVHEPLKSLSEVRREAAEKKQKQRDDNVNKALFMLSLLSFFSALVDSIAFADTFFGWFLDDTGVKIAQIICIVLIVITLIIVIKNLISSRSDK